MATALRPDRTTSEDPNPLVTLLRQCVVPVSGDGEFRGTGFLVAPGEVLTCAHVVHGVSDITVDWEGVGLSASVVKALPALEVGDPAARFYPYPTWRCCGSLSPRPTILVCAWIPPNR